MATPQNIIDRATSLIRVRTSGVTFSTDDANKNADVFESLQNLIYEWGEDGMMSIPAPATLTETLDVPHGTIRALNYNLAVEICGDFGIEPSPVVFKIAEDTKDRLEADIAIDISVDMSDLAFTFKQSYNVATD
jgi:hypothetical protein